MPETLPADHDRAQEFFNTHVRVPVNYDEYRQQQLESWRDTTQLALRTGEATKPMWLRRNGDDSTEFGACVDYVIPDSDSWRSYASIDISSDGGFSDLTVYLPAQDGSGEPVAAFSEAYTLTSLGRALEFIDEAVTRHTN